MAALTLANADRDLYEEELRNSDDDLITALAELKGRTGELSSIVSDLEHMAATRDQAIAAHTALLAELDDFEQLQERFTGHKGYSSFEESMFRSCSNVIVEGLNTRKPEFDSSIVEEIVTSFITGVREPDSSPAVITGPIVPYADPLLVPSGEATPSPCLADRLLAESTGAFYCSFPVVSFPSDSSRDGEAIGVQSDSTPEEHVILD